MALLWVDGFDSYPAGADMVERGYVFTTDPIIDPVEKRDGIASLSMPATGTLTLPPLTGAPYTDRVVVAFWFNYTGIPTALTNLVTFESTSGDETHLAINTDFQLVLTRDPAVVLGTAGLTHNMDQWHFVEISMRINNSIGSNEVVVRCDEISLIVLANGTDTQATTGNINTIKFHPTANGVTRINYDGLVVYSESGPQWNANSFVGQHNFVLKPPTSDGYQTGFWGSDGDKVDNYLQVDENPHDGDTTYNESDVPMECDAYKHDILTGGNPVLGVQVFVVCKKTSAAARTMRQLARSGGNNYFSGSKALTNGVYEWFHEIWEVDPDTGVQWTPTGMSNAEFGVEVET